MISIGAWALDVAVALMPNGADSAPFRRLVHAVVHILLHAAACVGKVESRVADSVDGLDGARRTRLAWRAIFAGESALLVVSKRIDWALRSTQAVQKTGGALEEHG